MVVVTLEVEYDAQTEREARLRALRDAETLFQQDDVLSVTADVKRSLPITEAYLTDSSSSGPGGAENRLHGVVGRVAQYVPGQMSVDECISEALRDAR